MQSGLILFEYFNRVEPFVSTLAFHSYLGVPTNAKSASACGEPLMRTYDITLGRENIQVCQLKSGVPFSTQVRCKDKRTFCYSNRIITENSSYPGRECPDGVSPDSIIPARSVRLGVIGFFQFIFGLLHFIPVEYRAGLRLNVIVNSILAARRMVLLVVEIGF